MADKIGEFLAKHDWRLLETIKGWRVERDDVSTDVVRLSLPARDGERFIIRFLCDEYPEKTPSVVFIDESRRSGVITAWPAGTAEFYKVVKHPPNSFLCTDLTREGIQHHSEWINGRTAWKGSTHTLMDLFNYCDGLLNSNEYTGRAK